MSIKVASKAQLMADMIDAEIVSMFTDSRRAEFKALSYYLMYGGKMPNLITKAHFIGGSMSGQEREFAGAPTEYVVSVNRGFGHSARWEPASWAKIAEIETEVYLRHQIGVTRVDASYPSFYTLYVYAGIRPRRPALGDVVRYRQDEYVIDDVAPDGFLADSTTIEATRQLRLSDGTSTLRVKDAALIWNTAPASCWTVRKGSQVQLENDSNEIAP